MTFSRVVSSVRSRSERLRAELEPINARILLIEQALKDRSMAMALENSCSTVKTLLHVKRGKRDSDTALVPFNLTKHLHVAVISSSDRSCCAC